MKKVLLATTALVAFAGAANAEIKLSGYAEIGIDGGDGVGVYGDVGTQFHNDWQVNIDMSSATDSGLEFGAHVQLEEGNTPSFINGGSSFYGYHNSGPQIDDEYIWVSGSFGKVTLGETDGALDWAVDEIYSGSAINDDHSTHAGAYWNTGMDGWYDNQILRYEYSFGDFGVAVSAEQAGFGYYWGEASGADPILGIGVHYSGDMNGTTVSAGLGYQTANSVQVTALSLGAKMANGFSANFGYADFDGNDSWWGLAGAYTTGALLVGLNYGEYDSGDKGWGLVANYDLGGGASAQFGYGSSNNASGGSYNGWGHDTWSAGLALSF